MIVTIDGPAGSGKSTVAKLLSERLGFRFLDTGAMYRAIAWYFYTNKVDPASTASVRKALAKLDLKIDGARVSLDGRDVSRAIRSPKLSQLASLVAVIPEVRHFLVQRQREIAQHGNYVCEGRDQGTVVFPQAQCKFFLDAAPEIRARRRWLEIRDRQPDLDLDSVIAEQKIRDLRDETRKVGRLVKADDAVEIDVGEVTLEQLVDQLQRYVRDAMQRQTT